jgi:Ni,Fe-hydrogenase III small subunit
VPAARGAAAAAGSAAAGAGGGAAPAPASAVVCDKVGAAIPMTRVLAAAEVATPSLATNVKLATALDAKMQNLLGRSLRLRSVAAGSCGGCEAELNALGNVVFDMGRFGVQFVASPRHADGIVITGAVSTNMREALKKTYEAVPDPCIVIAVGTCAISGGVFRESEEVNGGVPSSIPVDLWIPGCPPHPLTVLDGLLRLLGKLDGEATSPSALP